MKYKTLVVGRGFIGEKVAAEMNCDICSKRIMSVQDGQAIADEYKPDIIINCVGHTGEHNVDDCEKDKEKTLVANTFVPVILAETALRNNIKLVHISSGCIYNFDYSKQKPITEDEIPDFFGLYYSRTKIYAERALEVIAKKYRILITRIRIPLDIKPHPKNVLTKLIQYRNIIDVPNSVTYVPDFLGALRHLIKIDAFGIFNVVNKYGLRYPDLMEVYKKYVPDFNYTVVDYRKFTQVRTNLVMSVKKLEKTGFAVRPIKDVLDECVKEYVR
ncbi:MAG: sugar nucleotide-binding protein [Candidatus Omnitrophica bacterium]|nr:sugar nucleotide-binding protein [Candidatus Omnitrophota bacterium]MDD5775892.1 sugar nucleotide-binding protein [Candidatus Omnitrophota bacterium]